MATTKEIIYTIRNIMYNHQVSDDFELPDKRILHFVNVERAFLLKQYLDKDRIVPKSVEQTLGCVPLECVDMSSCADCGFNSDEFIHRTPELPKPINFNFATDSAGQLFTFVGLVTGKPIEFTSEAIAYWGQYGKYAKLAPRAYYSNGRIYIRNLSNVEIIQVKGVFDNPEELAKFSSCDGSVCYSEDSEYPIMDYHLSIIYSTIIQKYIVPAMQLPKDKINDGSDIIRLQ